MFKDWIISVFDIRTYEKECDEALSKYANLSKAHETIKLANDILARDCIEMEKKIDMLVNAPDEYVEREVEQRWSERVKEHEDKVKRAYHRGVAIGRRSSYSELGVIVIEAHEQGKDVAVADDGVNAGIIADDFAMIEGEVKEMTLPDEIEIEDLLRL